MTVFPIACRRGMIPAFTPFGHVTAPKPGTCTVRAFGIASLRSMSNMAAGATSVSTAPVICHCHVVPGAGFHTPAAGDAGFDGATELEGGAGCEGGADRGDDVCEVREHADATTASTATT